MLNKSVLLGTILVVCLFLVPRVLGNTITGLRPIEDNYGYSYAPDTIQCAAGSCDNLYIGSYAGGKNEREYIKWNISTVPAGSIVTNATYCLYAWEMSSIANEVGSHHVYSQLWDESVLTWNNAPCGGGGLNASCNATYDSMRTPIQTLEIWVCWDATSGVHSDVDNSFVNTSVLLKLVSENSTPNIYKEFRSSEGDADKLPMLNITYDTTTSSTTTSSTTTSTTSTSSTTTTTEETTTTLNYAQECGLNCTENPFTEVGESCDSCLRDFEAVYSCDVICGSEENVCTPNFYCEEYLQMGFRCGCCCKDVDTTTTITTTTVCPSPTGRCCFVGDVTGDCCLDDNFLYSQKIYFVNGTSYFFNQTTFCSNGCDDGLNQCSVPNFWAYGIILIFVILIMLVLKWLRVW